MQHCATQFCWLQCCSVLSVHLSHLNVVIPVVFHSRRECRWPGMLRVATDHLFLVHCLHHISSLPLRLHEGQYEHHKYPWVVLSTVCTTLVPQVILMVNSLRAPQLGTSLDILSCSEGASMAESHSSWHIYGHLYLMSSMYAGLCWPVLL